VDFKSLVSQASEIIQLFFWNVCLKVFVDCDNSSIQDFILKELFFFLPLVPPIPSAPNKLLVITFAAVRATCFVTGEDIKVDGGLCTLPRYTE
jgi:hypothetical protein